jgi:hypothetical protein
MLCTLVFVGYSHAFINGRGSWFHKKCYYACDAPMNGGWYNRVWAVSPNYKCNRRIKVNND